MFCLGNVIPLYLFSQCLLMFIHHYNSIKDFIFIYLSHSLQHVLASNVQGGSEVEASPLQLKYKLIIMLLYQKWENKMYINKTLKMLQCPGDVDSYVDYSHYSCFMSLEHCNILTILLIYIV